MIWVAGALFGIQILVLVWGWRAIDDDQRMSFSIGVPPSIQGTTSKRTGLMLRSLVAFFLIGGSLWAHMQGDSIVVLVGALLLAFFSMLDALTIRRMTRNDQHGAA